MIVPLLLIGGLVFSGMVAGLFSLIDIKVGKFIEEYIAIYGGIGSLLVGSVVSDRMIKNSRTLAPIIAQLFTPLFLVFLVIYLMAMIAAAKDPFHDRNFLIVFNGLMILILGMVVFSVSGRQCNRWTVYLDWINGVLVALTLVVNSIALSAIIFRLASYGLTPNRMAVLGANILIFIHLTGIALRWSKLLFRSASIADLEKWICGYMTVYLVWTGIVAFMFPIIFINYK